MTRTKTITLYTFDELTSDAQSRACADYRNGGDVWDWQSEWWDSAQAFACIAPIDIRSADYDRAHVETKWTGNSDVADLSGVRAWKWLENNGWFEWAERNARGECTMTGYCGDCPFADPINALRRAPAGVPELSQLFDECAQAWIYAAQKDMEHSYSDEAIGEALTINEYEFISNGSLA